MLALLPIIGGFLLGWLAPRRTALLLQTLFCAVAIAVVTMTAPDHGGEYGDVLWIAPVLVIVSAGAVLVGLRVGRPSRHAPSPQQ